MQDRIEAIVLGAEPGDVQLLEGLLAAGSLDVVGVVGSVEGGLAEWCKASGIGLFQSFDHIPRLTPGQVLVLLDEKAVPPETVRQAASLGTSILTRDVVSLLGRASGAPNDRMDKVHQALDRYRRIFEDYFPTSKHSSTAVKMAACLTEATSLWSASGGAILAAAPGQLTLTTVAGHRGVTRDLIVTAGDGTLPAWCYSRGRGKVVRDLESDPTKLPEGIEAASAVGIPVKAGTDIIGVFFLWSDNKSHFEDLDADLLSLFGYYLASLMEIELLGEKLGESLVIDPATCLFNKRQFINRLHQEVQRARRYSLQVSLVVIGFDDLHAYEQACGHMLAGLALSDVAEIVKKETRDVDMAARIGDQEIGIILPETGRLGALKQADRLRTEVASYPFPSPEGRPTVGMTISAGIASFPGTSSDEDELVERALEALEEARREGPNSIKIWEE